MAITDWPAHERPRERLIKGGPAQLSDAELLAIFLRTGVNGKSAVDLGREIMMHFGSLSGLFAARLEDFSALSGIGPAKYAQLQAIMELARRLLAEDMQKGVALTASDKVKDYLSGFENLFCIGRNGQHRYNNMDHSMLTAMEAVDSIKNGTSHEAVWEVNTEKEYHEKK